MQEKEKDGNDDNKSVDSPQDLQAPLDAEQDTLLSVADPTLEKGGKKWGKVKGNARPTMVSGGPLIDSYWV